MNNALRLKLATSQLNILQFKNGVMLATSLLFIFTESSMLLISRPSLLPPSYIIAMQQHALWVTLVLQGWHHLVSLQLFLHLCCQLGRVLMPHLQCCLDLAHPSIIRVLVLVLMPMGVLPYPMPVPHVCLVPEIIHQMSSPVQRQEHLPIFVALHMILG
jgi:hypothetical protein